MASKLLNLLVLASIAIMACSFGATPTTALSVDTHNVVRHLSSHGSIAKRKRASSKRCKQRPSSSAAAPQPTHSDSKPQSKPQSNSNKGNNAPSGGGAVYSGGSFSGSKVGLAWPNGDDPSLAQYKTARVSWLYTWSPECPSQTNRLGLQCIPMLWGDDQISSFTSLVKAGYGHTVLGMNEVNQPGQSYMSVSHGVQLWKTYIQPLKALGYYLVSPSTSSNPDGLTWIKGFLAQCDGCVVDAINLHYYDVTASGFQTYVSNYHAGTGNRKIWVTEWACQNFNGGPQCTMQQTVDFFREAMQFMDNTDYVEAYSAFGLMHNMQGVNPTNQLMGPDGSPTALGNFYIGK